jgi:prephenate dehydratase
MSAMDSPMRSSLDIQNHLSIMNTGPRVAFQGARGAYSEEAMEQVWKGCVQPIPSWSFVHVVRAVADGGADYGILPIENTIVGPITAAREALATTSRLRVFDEIIFPIRHALLGIHGAAVETLQSVSSHPVALAQCGVFLRRHPHLAVRHAYDTAGAANEVATRVKKHEGAIAGRAAAMYYNLQVLVEEIQDVPNNYTRFVVVGCDTGVRW